MYTIMRREPPPQKKTSLSFDCRKRRCIICNHIKQMRHAPVLVRLPCTSLRKSPAERTDVNLASSVDLLTPREELELDVMAPSTIEKLNSFITNETEVAIISRIRTRCCIQLSYAFLRLASLAHMSALSSLVSFLIGSFAFFWFPWLCSRFPKQLYGAFRFVYFEPCK